MKSQLAALLLLSLAAACLASAANQPSTPPTTQAGQKRAETRTPPLSKPLPKGKFVDIQQGANSISLTGIHLVLKNTSGTELNGATLQTQKFPDNSSSSVPAGGQAVSIPAGGTIEVTISHPPGWCNGYQALQAMVIHNGKIVGERTWSIPPSAKQ